MFISEEEGNCDICDRTNMSDILCVDMNNEWHQQIAICEYCIRDMQLLYGRFDSEGVRTLEET